MSRTSADRKIVVTPLSEDVLVGMHKHDYYEFNLVLAGTLYEYIEDQFYSIHQNEFVLLHPDVFHSIYPPANCVGFNILVDKIYFADLKKDLCASSPSALLAAVVEQKHYAILNVDKNEEIVAVIRLLKQTRQTSSLLIQLLKRRFEEFLLLLLLAEADEALSVIGSGNTSYEDKIAQISNYIRDHITAP